MYSYKHGVYQNMFHLVWQTKYRYEMMRKQKFKLAVKQALEDTAARHGIVFLELAVMPDHVHSVVDCPPTMSQSKALNLLKGASAHYLFQHFPKLRLRYPRRHFWSPGKAGRTVGDVDKETAIDYVRRQAQQTSLLDFSK